MTDTDLLDRDSSSTRTEKLLIEVCRRLDTITVPGGPALVGFATETKQIEQVNQLDLLVGLEIPHHDYIVLTYVPSGNGVGEIQTAIYKQGGAGGTIVGTLTLAYDGSNRLLSVTKS